MTSSLDQFAQNSSGALRVTIIIDWALAIILLNFTFGNAIKPTAKNVLVGTTDPPQQFEIVSMFWQGLEGI